MTHTVFDQVEALVKRLAPEPVCDDCISERLGLSASEHVQHKTSELSGMSGFERQKGPCSLCTDDKMVIRRKV